MLPERDKIFSLGPFKPEKKSPALDFALFNFVLHYLLALIMLLDVALFNKTFCEHVYLTNEIFENYNQNLCIVC